MSWAQIGSGQGQGAKSGTNLRVDFELCEFHAPAKLYC